MKRCPICNRTYTDESQNFCLEDGATLVADQTPTSGFGSMPSSAQSWQPNVPQNFAAPPRKKSNALFWVFGILGVVVVLGVVGFFGLLVAIGIAVGDNENNSNNSNLNRTNYNKSVNTNSTANTNSNTAANRTISNTSSNTTPGKAKYNESFSTWGVVNSEYGRAEYINGEYQIYAKKSDNYYVLIADTTLNNKYVTNNATTQITVRSVSGASPFLGYGLVVHSDTVPLKRDYAFLIRTDKDPAFRVVRHENKNEIELVKWTPASQIRTGTEPNDLEVRSDGKTLQFYINGKYATSISDSITGKGIVGLYTSGTPAVAFSDLKIYDNQ